MWMDVLCVCAFVCMLCVLCGLVAWRILVLHVPFKLVICCCVCEQEYEQREREADLEIDGDTIAQQTKSSMS